MIKLIKAIFIIGAITLTSTAMAIPITGVINIGATSTVTEDGSGTATGIMFTSSGTVTTAPGITPNGSFAPLAGTSTFVELTDFSFGGLPVSPLWKITEAGITYSFELTSMTFTDPTPDHSSLSIRGTGKVSVTGFDTTVGTWQYTQSGVSFSSQTVPAPGIALLLGLGLAGIGLTRRFRKA